MTSGVGGPERLTQIVSDHAPSNMSQLQLVTAAVLECIGLVLIIRLWRRKRPIPLWQRCAWSLVLLAPVLGWLIYGFLASNPETHPESLPERWGSEAPPGS